MSWYVKTFKDKGGHKNKNNKLMSLHIDNDKLLEKYKTIWTKVEDLGNITVIFHSHFYWLSTCSWKQILSASIVRQLFL